VRKINRDVVSNIGVRRSHYYDDAAPVTSGGRATTWSTRRLIYGDEKVWASRDEDQIRENNARHERFAAMLAERDAMRGGKQLAPASSATTLRLQGDDVSVTDGPFAETSEVLGGLYLIDAADLDVAIALAKQLPEAVVEIRPIVPPRGSGS
jgi:hypothetical protein